MIKAYITVLLGLLMLCCACRKKDPLAGIDKSALFAPPTKEELDAVQAAWQARDLSPRNITTEATHVIDNKLRLVIISFRASGSKQYAGVLVPTTQKTLPVRLYIAGFSLNDAVSRQSIQISSSATDTLPFVYVVPALKGQSLSLSVNGVEYKTPVSEGQRNDAFDGATDDAIACLNAVGKTFKEADTSKVMTQGGSRGGTVALLMAERDQRVKLAAAVAFPADLLALTAANQHDPTYKFQFLDALINGSATLEETRKKLLAASPLYFCNHLPEIQAHFGDQDNITPPAQGELLRNAMKDAGKEADIGLFIYKGRGHENIGNNNLEMQQRIENFFRQI
ncbi:alpha/beta hydrolase family protein [Chitinophaga sp.]|uniref:alpha/beta hydrolase family protein n=1 Tax=Chitinophaga sp. TaxID=1869181 RepID=UPI002F948C1E